MLCVVKTHYELMLPPIAALLLRDNLLQGLNGHLDHGVVRLICGEVLHPKAGGAEGAAKGVAVTAHIAVELPGDAHDQGQKKQVKAHAQKCIFDLQRGEDGDGEENGRHNDHEQKAGPAAGVMPGPDVLYRQFQAVFITEDGLVFCPMVGKHPLHLLHPGAENQIAQEDRHLEYALDHAAHP